MRCVLRLYLVGLLLGACTENRGPQGPQGPMGPQGPQGPPGAMPVIATGSGIVGTGDATSPLALPAVLNPPIANGASAAIVQSITVNAKSDCGNVAPAPHLEVYLNGALMGGIDVTGSTYADTAPFTVSPNRYASEIAVAFTNDNNNGGCDHNLYVDHVTLTTTAGTVTLSSTDAAHAVYDVGNFFDNVNVLPAGATMASSGALRFFIAPSPLHAPAPTAPSYLQPPMWSYSASGPVGAWTTL